MCQSLYAFSMISDRSRSGGSRKILALNPAMVGKHIDWNTPLTFMSRTRSWMSYAPGRISANPQGSQPYSSCGHEATAFSPMGAPTGSPWKTQTSVPFSLCTTLGAASRYRSGT